MIDLHCHILPGIDDGARDLGDALGMARQAEADGVEAICATPHLRDDHDVRIAELPERLNALRDAIARAGCRTRVLAGGEVSSGRLHRLDNAELDAVSLGGSGRWILLEPKLGPLDDTLDAAVLELRQRGFRALIAHPERHLAPDLVTRLQRLAAEGALIQATADYLVDPATREGMLALATSGVIHVLGSDSHSSRAGRTVTLAPALEALATIPSLAPHLGWIADSAPRGIVAGEELTPPF